MPAFDVKTAITLHPANPVDDYYRYSFVTLSTVSDRTAPLRARRPT